MTDWKDVFSMVQYAPILVIMIVIIGASLIAIWTGAINLDTIRKGAVAVAKSAVLRFVLP